VVLGNIGDGEKSRERLKDMKELTGRERRRI
jgi:hypothetical protein